MRMEGKPSEKGVKKIERSAYQKENVYNLLQQGEKIATGTPNATRKDQKLKGEGKDGKKEKGKS